MGFAWVSHGLRYGFAMVCGVSAVSLPPHSHGATRTPHTTALHIKGTLPRPKGLRRFCGANPCFSLTRACHASFPGRTAQGIPSTPPDPGLLLQLRGTGAVSGLPQQPVSAQSDGRLVRLASDAF